MSQSSVTHHNRLLATLSSDALARLKKYFEPVELTLGQTLTRADERYAYAYFPTQGMISLVQRLEDGGAIEVGLIGREGFLGVPLLLGVTTSPLEAMVQAKGQAIRIRASRLLAETERNPIFLAALLRYGHALHVQATQTAACNGRHPLPSRLARWLLEAHDRIGLDVLHLSHELLSMMLGMRRAGITVVLQKFKAKGLIATGRGTIRILNRKGVEAASCECYRAVKREYTRILTKA